MSVDFSSFVEVGVILGCVLGVIVCIPWVWYLYHHADPDGDNSFSEDFSNFINGEVKK